MENVKGKINDWQVFIGNTQLGVHFHITGRFDDGRWIRTSRVLKIEGNIAYTKNSTYELGFPKLKGM